MIVKYNSLNKTDPPVITLCNPGSIYTNGYLTNVVGILTDCEAEEIVFNFNAASELNFRINKVTRSSTTENNHIQNLYYEIKNRRLLFIDEIGYFVITNVENNYQDGIEYKDVRAQSVEIEIQQKQIPYIEDGTYRFMTDGNETTVGILNMIVSALPIWTIGHIDEAIKGKWRTFEDIDTTLNCLGFLLENIQDAYECIVLFDIINRTINIYDQSNYVKRTYIHLTKDDVVKSLNISENADDLYTAISVEGDDDIGISAINPLGGNVIYNFHYYLDWMTTSLKNKVTAWQNAVNNSKERYYNNSLEYFTKLGEKANLQAEIDKLDTQITMYKRCKDNIVASADTSLVGEYNTEIVKNGGESIVVYTEVSDTIRGITGQISSCESEKSVAQSSLNSVQAEIDVYQGIMEEINAQLSITSYFTNEEYEELAGYIFEGSYKDEYVTVTSIMTYSEKFSQMKILYDRAEKQLLKISEPSQKFDVDAESLIFEKSFSHWNDQLETGCLINVELDKNDCAWLFLSTITINYDDHNLKFTFGNRYNKYDTKSLFDKVLGGISKSANTIQYIKDHLYPLKDGTFDDMKDAIQSSRNITMAGALVSENEEVVIDGSGYTGRVLLSNGTYDPHQIKITGKNIVFTDDAWDTCKTAIGEIVLDGTRAYGINGELIIGEMIVGERLAMQNPEGNLRFDENGITIFNSNNSFVLNPNGDTLFSIKKGNREIFGLDSRGALHVEADGTGIDLTSNNTIQQINSRLQVNENGITAETSRATAAEGDLSSSISQTASDIKSVVSSAVSKYDTSRLNYSIDLYGYGMPDGIYDASENNGAYYLNQNSGYVYRSNGSGWVQQERLELITAKLQTQINQNSNNISLIANTNNSGTVISLNSNAVKIAWNNVSNYIQFESGQLKIYSSNVISDSNLLMSLTSTGNWYYNNGVTVGKIGTNKFAGTEYRGLVFDLEPDAYYMTWAWRDGIINEGEESIPESYDMKWTYVTNNSTVGSRLGDPNTLNAGCDIDMHNYKIRNWNFDGGNITGVFSGCYVTEFNSDSTVKTWRSFSLEFDHGILKSATW